MLSIKFRQPKLHNSGDNGRDFVSLCGECRMEGDPLGGYQGDGDAQRVQMHLSVVWRARGAWTILQNNRVALERAFFWH